MAVRRGGPKGARMTDLHCFNCDTIRPVDEAKRVIVCCDDPMIGVMRTTNTADPKQWPEFVSGVMHKNTMEGVQRAFSKEEWRAASDAVWADGNQSWCGVVRRAVRNARGGGCTREHEDE